MTFSRRSAGHTALAALISILVCAGCSEEEGPAGAEAEETGTIIIYQAPDDMPNAGWSLTGPQDETGSGDTTLTEMPAGTYALAWNDVTEHITPSGDTKDLSADGEISFVGIYMPEDFALIPAGVFTMGSPIDEDLRGSDETLHTVTLTTRFYMLATEVTNAQYAFMAQWALDNGYCTATSTTVRDALDGSTEELLDLDGNFSEISYNGASLIVDPGREQYPVMIVTWYGAAAYCDWMSMKYDLPRAYDHFSWLCNHNDPYDAPGYRLPTEAEWEYACRAGTLTPFNTGECLDAGTEANYNGSYPYTGCPSGPNEDWSVPVRSYPANMFGLYEMHGNMAEWCNDWYADNYEGDVTDPVGPFTAFARVWRGGIWFNPAQVSRSAHRDANPPFGRGGFRPVKSYD